MKKSKYYLYLNADESRVLLNSLVQLKNTLNQQGRYTDFVDEIIMKVAAIL